MPSQIDIANMALYRVGSSIRITTFDESVEKTDAVRQAAFWYPITRDEVLASAPWGFARKSVALAAVTDTTFPGWNVVYEYPEDCVQGVAVCDSGGVRNSTFWMNAFRDEQTVNVPKVPFQVGSRGDGDSNVIMTDIDQAYLYYIFRQTVTATFSPLFVSAFAWKLGSELGSAVQAKADRIQRCLQMYEQTLGRAMAQMMNEAQQDPDRESPSVQVRGW